MDGVKYKNIENFSSILEMQHGLSVLKVEFHDIHLVGEKSH